jgi:hypothetical protein
MAKPAALKATPGKAAPAKPASPGTGRRRRHVGGAATLAIAALTAIAVTALPIFILFAVGLLPSLAAIVIDRDRGHYLARTVGAMNLAGVVPYAIGMWEHGISLAALQQLVTSPFAWLVMYGAAGFGWVLFLGLPQITAIVLDVQAEQLRSRLEARAKTLQEEWGEEVTGEKRES